MHVSQPIYDLFDYYTYILRGKKFRDFLEQSEQVHEEIICYDYVGYVGGGGEPDDGEAEAALHINIYLFIL